jgi:hypothetical protein
MCLGLGLNFNLRLSADTWYISWGEYLSEIQQNSLTGEWAKEVATYLVNSEGIRSVKES